MADPGFWGYQPYPGEPGGPGAALPAPTAPRPEDLPSNYAFDVPFGAMQYGTQGGLERLRQSLAQRGITGAAAAGAEAQYLQGANAANAGVAGQIAGARANQALNESSQTGYMGQTPTLGLYNSLQNWALGIGQLTGQYSSPFNMPGGLSQKQLIDQHNNRVSQDWLKWIFRAILPFIK